MACKSDIVEGVAGELGLSKTQTGEAFDGIFGAITDALAKGERVQVAGFGTFSVSHRAKREGRNPQTGEPMTIPASNSVRFKAGKALKDAVN